MAVQNIVTVMGKKLGPGGVTSDELVDRCRTAARVMREVGGSLVIPTGGDSAMTGVTEAEAVLILIYFILFYFCYDFFFPPPNILFVRGTVFIRAISINQGS